MNSPGHGEYKNQFKPHSKHANGMTYLGNEWTENKTLYGTGFIFAHF